MQNYRNTFLEDSAVMRDALKRGIINTHVTWKAPAYVLAAITSKSIVPRAAIKNVDQAPAALRSIVHTFERSATLTAPNNYVLELARVCVPDGQIAHLTGIEQYLAEPNGRLYASSCQFWGMPYNETVPLADIVWFLRLEDYYGLQAPQFLVTAAVLPDPRPILPGMPWPDLPEFSGLWYPAHNKNGFRGTIPSGKALRFLVYVPASALVPYDWRVAGRLTARLQAELSNEACINTRILP